MPSTFSHARSTMQTAIARGRVRIASSQHASTKCMSRRPAVTVRARHQQSEVQGKAIRPASIAAVAVAFMLSSPALALEDSSLQYTAPQELVLLADKDAADAVEVVEEELPVLEEQIATLPPQEQQSMERQLQAIESEITQVDELVEKAPDSPEAVQEARGIQDQIDALKSLFGLA